MGGERQDFSLLGNIPDNDVAVLARGKEEVLGSLALASAQLRYRALMARQLLLNHHVLTRYGVMQMKTNQGMVVIIVARQMLQLIQRHIATLAFIL